MLLKHASGLNDEVWNEQVQQCNKNYNSKSPLKRGCHTRVDADLLDLNQLPSIMAIKLQLKILQIWRQKVFSGWPSNPLFFRLLLRSVHCGFQVFIIIEGISLESLTPSRCSYQPANIVGLVGYFRRPRFSVKTAGFGCVFGRQIGLVFLLLVQRVMWFSENTLGIWLPAVPLIYNNLNINIEGNMIPNRGERVAILLSFK